MVISAKKKPAGQAGQRHIQVVRERERQQRAGGQQHAYRDHPAAGRCAAARASQQRIGDHAAERIAQHSGEENARGEQRGLAQVELVAVQEILRDPAQKQPQIPAIAEIDRGHRRHAPEQRQPRHACWRPRVDRRRQRCQLLARDARMIRRKLGEGQRPEQPPRRNSRPRRHRTMRASHSVAMINTITAGAIALPMRAAACVMP